MPRVLVTGATGQLGQSILALTGQFPAMEFRGTGREELSLEYPDRIPAFLDQYKPDYIINCAAYTAVDKAENEAEQEMLYRVNAEAVRQLALYSGQTGCKLIHISTDYVFDGTGNRPYREDDPVAPVNAYGASKLKGEEYLLAADPQGIIIRTSWVYAREGRNFVNTMLRLMKEKKKLAVVDDQWGSPTWAVDLAKVILHMISSGNWHPGIYHYSNAGAITWYNFALEIQRLTGSDCHIDPVPTSGFPTPARRPAYSVLDKTKISQVFGLTIPDWKESLAKCLRGK